MVAQLDATYLRTRPWKVWSRLVSYALFEGRPLTTRGRWLNPLVFAHFAVEKRLPALRRVDRPVFILGTGRSGSTILGMVLSIHREVGFLNEPKALWHAIHAGEDLIGSYSRGPARYRLGATEARPEVVRNAHRLFGAYLAISRARRIVDKYPELVFRVPFVKAIFPDAKFLFLVRNGWDTCRSIGHWSVRRGRHAGRENHDWWGADRRKWQLLVEQIVPEHPDLAPYAATMHGWTNQADMAAVEWLLAMREGIRAEQDFGADVLRVEYATLCRNPREQIDGIAAFLELAPGDEPFRAYAAKVLRPAPSQQPFEINRLISVPFRQTMAQLGYGD